MFCFPRLSAPTSLFLPTFSFQIEPAGPSTSLSPSRTLQEFPGPRIGLPQRVFQFLQRHHVPLSGVSSELFDIASNAARPEAIPLSLFAPGASNKVKMGQTISFATTKDRSATLQPPAWFLTGSSLYFMCGLTTSLDHPLIRLCHEFDSDAFTRSSSGALYHKFSNRQ
ncbi:BQ5605_C002g01023 [Microbotryum silenes-dioicae]|uniref:BQ5605_C002g01023 protein n=1 Tax=Microbotryum silenes-dioicae TaxID=796604 RepID=A0A2X0LXK7_9BASI|nr:BQ5605_C002g01023 [Microbotryum silenes-dioicae]